MGKKDLTEKLLMAQNKVFAEIWNKFGDLKEEIRPEDLTDAPTEHILMMKDGPKSRMRDIAKRYKGKNLRFALLGLENQTAVDPNMPLRVLIYDAGNYLSQINRKEKKLSPSVTWVMYFGYDKPWDGPCSLKEMMDIPEELKDLVEDYKIRVIQWAWMTDEERAKLTGDAWFVADCLHSWRTTGEFSSAADGVLEFPVETWATLMAATNQEYSYEELLEDCKSFKKGETRMSNLIDQYIEKLKSEGKEDGFKLGKEDGFKLGKEDGFKLGKEDGFKLGKEDGAQETRLFTIKNMLRLNMSLDVISQVTGMSCDEVQKIADSAGV